MRRGMQRVGGIMGWVGERGGSAARSTVSVCVGLPPDSVNRDAVSYEGSGVDSPHPCSPHLQAHLRGIGLLWPGLWAQHIWLRIPYKEYEAHCAAACMLMVVLHAAPMQRPCLPLLKWWLGRRSWAARCCVGISEDSSSCHTLHSCWCQ